MGRLGRREPFPVKLPRSLVLSNLSVKGTLRFNWGVRPQVLWTEVKARPQIIWTEAGINKE